MLFSFLVPVYNTSKYLDQCMKSLLCQKGADFEIVLIDDGSTDESSEMCDRYVQDYPHIVRVVHKENEGLLLTRRRGFKEARGDWFICVDSDDYVNSNLLESVVEAIKKYSPDMVMYNFEYVTDEGLKSSSRLHIKNESVYVGAEKTFMYSQKLLSDDVNNIWSKAIKRDILDIDRDYSTCGLRNMCEDAIQVLPLFTNSQKIVYLQDALYCYRKGQNSITAVTTYNNWMAMKTCFLITEEYLDIWSVSQELRQKFYTHNCEVLSNFVRWLFAQSQNQLEETPENVINTISKSDAFERCINNYNKAYAKTKYLRFSVPIIMKLVEKGRIRLLKCILRLEEVFYRLRSRL